MSIFPKFIKKSIPTNWLVKEIKFKRKHKMGYFSYMKNRYLNFCINMKKKLFPNVNNNIYKDVELIDYPLFTGVFLSSLLTGVLFIPTILIILFLKLFITAKLGPILILTIFTIGMLPIAWIILKYSLYYLLKIINFTFRIKYEEK